MNVSSADFTKLTVQQVADLIIDQDANGVLCKGMVDGRVYSLRVELIIDE